MHLNLSKGPCVPSAEGASSDIESSDIESFKPADGASKPPESRPGVRGPPGIIARSPPAPARTVRASAISSAARLASTSPPPAVGANLSRTTVAFGACGAPSFADAAASD